ncbi:hypothetical protein KI387_024302, partial [Taxus chinensis]
SRAMSRSRGSFPAARVSRLSLLEALVNGHLEEEVRWVAGGAAGGIEEESCAAGMGGSSTSGRGSSKGKQGQQGEAGLAAAEPIKGGSRARRGRNTG